MGPAHHPPCLQHLGRASCDLQTPAMPKPNALRGICEVRSPLSPPGKLATWVQLGWPVSSRVGLNPDFSPYWLCGLGKGLPHPEPRFPHLQMEHIYLIGLIRGLNGRVLDTSESPLLWTRRPLRDLACQDE